MMAGRMGSRLAISSDPIMVYVPRAQTTAFKPEDEAWR
jgi:hypothetical protein